MNESISKDKKWTVRRLRRRARSTRKRKNQVTEKEKQDNEEKEKDTTSETEDSKDSLHSTSTEKLSVISDSSLLIECGFAPQSRNVCLSTDETAQEIPKTPVKNENIVNAEKMLFGFSLGKHHVSSIELDSDQESTDGEEEITQNGEIPDRLTADWLLW